MLRSLFGNPAATRQLGETLVACRAQSGRPPKGCVAIHLDEEGLFTLLTQGDRLQVKKGQQGWFIHPGPYSVSFAPHPHTPEAGLQTCLHPQPEDSRLALFLAQWQGDSLSTGALAELARQTAGPHCLLPGMDQQEIDSNGGVRARFSNAMQGHGFSCSAMQRLDLADQVSTADRLWQDLNWPSDKQPEPLERSQPMQRDASLRQTAELAVTLGMAQASIPWWRMEKLDQQLNRKLQQELSWLVRVLQQQRQQPELPAADFRQIGEWLFRVQCQQQRIELLPTLNSRIPGLESTPLERRKQVAAMRQAVEQLNQLKALAGAPETTDRQTRAQAFEQHLSELERQLQQRARQPQEQPAQ